MSIILITREPKAGKITALKLKNLGYETLLSSLIRIKFKKFILPKVLDFDYLIITSFNAARSINSYLNLKSIKVIAIGLKTATYLAQNGFNISLIFEKIEQFVNNVNMIGKNLKFLYLSGNHVSMDLTSQLNICGKHLVHRLVVYRSLECKNFNINILAKIRFITFYSERTAQIFVNKTSKYLNNTNQHLEEIICICLSQNIAESLKTLKFKQVLIALAPNENCMLDIFKRLKINPV